MHTSNNHSSQTSSLTKAGICPVCSQKNSVQDTFCQKCESVLPNAVINVKYQSINTPKMSTERKTRAVNNNKNALITFLSLSIGLGALLLGGVTFYRSQVVSTQQATERGKAEVKTKAVIAAQNLEQYVGKHYLQVQEMAASPFLSDRKIWDAWSLERKKEYFQNNFVANSDGMDSYVVIDAKTGNTVFSGGTGTKTKNNKHLDYFQQVVEQKKPVIVPHRQSTKTGIAYIYMAAPSFDDEGNLLFVTRTRIRFDEVRDEIAKSLDNLNSVVGDSQANLNFFLVDKIGRIIASEDSEVMERHINKLFPVAELMREEQTSSVGVESRFDNSSYYVAYAPVVETRGLPELDWSMFVVADMD